MVHVIRSLWSFSRMRDHICMCVEKFVLSVDEIVPSRDKERCHPARLCSVQERWYYHSFIEKVSYHTSYSLTLFIALFNRKLSLELSERSMLLWSCVKYNMLCCCTQLPGFRDLLWWVVSCCIGEYGFCFSCLNIILKNSLAVCQNCVEIV